jgi:hypothetical protein
MNMDHLREFSKEKPELTEEPQNENKTEPVEYCEVCFLSFGSQEPRIKKNDKTVHIDCAKSA